MAAAPALGRGDPGMLALSVRATKQAALIGLDLPLAAFTNQYYAFQQMMLSHDLIEGPKAFARSESPMEGE